MMRVIELTDKEVEALEESIICKACGHREIFHNDVEEDVDALQERNTYCNICDCREFVI